jgi:hypothetical protein
MRACLCDLRLLASSSTLVVQYSSTVYSILYMYSKYSRTEAHINCVGFHSSLYGAPIRFRIQTFFFFVASFNVPSLTVHANCKHPLEFDLVFFLTLHTRNPLRLGQSHKIILKSASPVSDIEELVRELCLSSVTTCTVLI